MAWDQLIPKDVVHFLAYPAIGGSTAQEWEQMQVGSERLLITAGPRMCIVVHPLMYMTVCDSGNFKSNMSQQSCLIVRITNSNDDLQGTKE